MEVSDAQVPAVLWSLAWVSSFRGLIRIFLRRGVWQRKRRSGGKEGPPRPMPALGKTVNGNFLHVCMFGTCELFGRARTIGGDVLVSLPVSQLPSSSSWMSTESA